MKPLATVLIASAFLAATYVASSAPARAGGKRCAAYVDQVLAAEDQTNADLDVSLDLAAHGYPVRPEVERLQSSAAEEDLMYVGLPDQCVIQLMLTQELNQLQALAMLYMVHEAQLHDIELSIVLARFERAVIRVDEAWQKGEIADDIAFMSIATMRADASAYLASLGVGSIRQRLQDAMARLIVRGNDALQRAEAVRDTFRTLYELRLEIALRVMERKIGDGTLQKLDVQRVETAVRGLENLGTSLVPFDCAS